MRIAGWTSLLAARLEAARAAPFVWGQHDCATWAFDLRRDLTGGEDIAALWRGRYRTQMGAVRVLRRLGWPSLEVAGRDLLGVPLANRLLAQRGDMVLGGADPAFGICMGAKAAFVAPEGLVLLPLDHCRMAWRV